jgi:hypothetical protein
MRNSERGIGGAPHRNHSPLTLHHSPLINTTQRTIATTLTVLSLHAISLFFLAADDEGSTMMAADAQAPLLVHNVYFSLNDPSPANVQKLVASCKKYLTDHPGTVFFAAGTLADLDRPVNDRDFDVALHVIFKDRASHDQYQTAPRHLQFIEENKADWKKVRVFDSDCQAVSK